MTIILITCILIITLVLLITDAISVDLVGIGLIVVLILTGMLTPLEGVAGFANPAVITVGAMFMISRGLMRTGAVGFIGETVIRYARGKLRLAFLMVLIIVALASAFINNTPVVVLFIPIIMHLACEYSLSPSKFLIPISYASILAGMCTLIGTSTNIIVSDLSIAHGYGGLEMFELAAVGFPIALIGIVFLFLVAPILMPSHTTPVCEMENREDRRYLAELRITPKSNLVGSRAGTQLSLRHPTLELFEIVRDTHIFYPDQDHVMLQEGDLLLVKGSATDLVAILQGNKMELPHQRAEYNFNATDQDSMIVEVIIPPQSSFIGQHLLETRLQGDKQVHVIAIKRRRMHYSSQKIQSVRLQVGDILLIRCTKDKLDRLRSESDGIIVEDIHHEIVYSRKAPWALAIFGGIVVAASTGLAGIMESALTGVCLMILTGCLQLRMAYRALQGDVLLLIAGTIALGSAMEKCGAAQYYASTFLSFFQGASPTVILSAMILLTSISTQLLSNNATAVLLLPIAISTAQTLGVDARPFIIGVCVGASACFAAPMGYQTNLLVYGPGGYRFNDYLKLGIPLNVMVILMGAWLIPHHWPF